VSIEDRLASIEAKRARLMDLLSAMEPAAITAHPRPGKWSMLEIVEHLVLSEVGVFGDLAELEHRTPQRRSPKDRILYLVVLFVLRFDVPVRVPSRAMIPKGSLSLQELQRQWEANHHRLRAWATSSDQRKLQRPLFLHPVAGPMTTVQSLRMLEVHLDRHARQIRAHTQLMPDGAGSRRGAPASGLDEAPARGVEPIGTGPGAVGRTNAHGPRRVSDPASDRGPASGPDPASRR